MCLVCPLQSNAEVAIAKLLGTSGYLTHPPGHCGLELLPTKPSFIKREAAARRCQQATCC